MGPMDRIEPYVGAGGGVFYSTLNVTGNLLGTTANLDETDTSLGSVLLAGVNYQMWQNWALGVEYRRVSVKANFGSVIPGDVEVGGNSVMATLRWSPGGPK